MGTTIKLKRSATQSLIPGTGSLALGELAVNTYDGVVYLKKSVASVESVVALDPTKLANGTSNVTVNSSGNVNISVGGNVLTVTSTGANITGTANVSGNANVGNLGTAQVLASANITAPQLISNVTTGTAPLVVTSTTQVANLNVALAGNAVNLNNGTSNVVVTSSGNVTVGVAGNSAVFTVTGVGANLTGNLTTTGIKTDNYYYANGSAVSFGGGSGLTYTASSTAPTSPTLGDEWYDTSSDILYIRATDGTSTFWLDISSQILNSTFDNLTAVNAAITTGNITTINSNRIQNGNSNITITANSNVTIAVTAANSYTFATGSFAPSANGTVQLGLTGARWSNIWGLASSAQYADLAERYSSDETYDPGTVVIFGGSAEITVTSKDHDRRVAGVVSTAPGYLMNDNDKQDDLMIAIGLTGRVPTKVLGPVEKGDLIVTSDQPGIAMKMIDSSFKPGCVIGKSLEDHPDDTVKTIEVVVGRF